MIHELEIIERGRFEEKKKFNQKQESKASNYLLESGTDKLPDTLQKFFAVFDKSKKN